MATKTKKTGRPGLPGGRVEVAVYLPRGMAEAVSRAAGPFPVSAWVRALLERELSRRASLMLGGMNEAQAAAVARVLEEVAGERANQHAKWGEQNHPDGTGRMGDVECAQIAKDWCNEAARTGRLSYRVIAEEEIAEAYAETEPERLRAELVQAAAVLVAWIEAIDRRGKA